MPRDVVSREMTMVSSESGCSGEVYLDMTGIADDVWSGKLSDLRQEIMEYLGIDARVTPVPVSPGIHFFMGGIRVNDEHMTNINGLYAAGEAACKYHGANRLGGNSMLGAIYGGEVAAGAAMKYDSELELDIKKTVADKASEITSSVRSLGKSEDADIYSTPLYDERLKDILYKGLGIIRTEAGMQEAYDGIVSMLQEPDMKPIDVMRARVGLAMVGLALNRKESRGAHYREDYPKTDETYRQTSVAQYSDGELKLSLAPIGSGGGGV